MYKNIYINGCSFTAGHELEEGTTFPELLEKELCTNTYNEAKNGQSFESIFINTINHLSKLNPKDTVVIIGLTWIGRTLVTFDNYNMSSTAADMNAKHFNAKYSLWRRLSSPLMFTKDKILGLCSEDSLEEVNKKFNLQHVIHEDIFRKINELKRLQIEADPNYIRGYETRYFAQLIALQSFLKEKEYKHIFTCYDTNIFKSLKEYLSYLHDKIDFDKILMCEYTKNPTSHPTKQDAKELTKIIIDKLQL